MKVYYPEMTVTMTTSSVIELYETPIRLNGKGIINMGMYNATYWMFWDSFTVLRYNEWNLFFLKLLTENVEVMLIAKTRTVQRNGKDYLIISEISPASNSLVSAADGKIEFKHDDAHPVINAFVNRVSNTNFQSFKGILDPCLDKFAGEVIRVILAPIFDKMAIQDLFCKQ